MVVLRLFGLLLDFLLLPLRLVRRGRAVRAGAWLAVTIDGPVIDVVATEPSWRRFLQTRAQKAVSLHRLDEVVRAMAADSRVKGLLVTIRSLSAGMGAATSLRAVLARARAAGKEVVVVVDAVVVLIAEGIQFGLGIVEVGIAVGIVVLARDPGPLPGQREEAAAG